MNTPKEVIDALRELHSSAEEPGTMHDTEWPMLESDIKLRMERGWTAQECYRYMKNYEGIIPHLSEDEALFRMSKVTDEATNRIARGTK